MVLIRALTTKAGTAWRLIRSNPSRFGAILRGDFYIYIVQSAKLESVPRPDTRPDLVFRELTESEIRQLAHDYPELVYQVEHMEIVGGTSAFGVFVNGRLANICWMMTEELDRRLPTRLVKVGPGEIEIGKAFTFPEFRGQGIYPFAIRNICAVARDRGFHRVFMITNSYNRVSRRGIEKAGLHRQGWIVLVFPPVIGTIVPVLWRAFRLSASKMR